jgi:hypothetical protein
MASYRGGEEEEIDQADTKEEADRLVDEYRLAFGATWTVWKENESDDKQEEGT